MVNIMSDKSYIAIDLKSFYASVECVERGLDPLKARLVVADATRTEKTICLAVSPALKAYGLPGRCRLFEVTQKAKEAGIDFITATPQMAKYMEYSNRIYNIYLKYVSAEDIHVYSVDEVFMDVTNYLGTYNMTAQELAMTMIRDVLSETGITATAGIGTNLYLAKIAMDIVAKHIPADENGVRIATLDEMSYRKLLWDHQPITDFWRVGPGYAKKLADIGLYTMGDIARCSLGKPGDFYNEDKLYKLFGVNAELLIDHAWGWEPCTMKQIKAYKPQNNSLSSGQVLHCPYDFEKGRLIVREMTDLLVLDLVRKGLLTDQIVLTVGYDIECLTDPALRRKYKGPVAIDWYGREVPKPAHGSVNLGSMTASAEQILKSVTELYERIVNKDLMIRRAYVVANHVTPRDKIEKKETYEQLNLFTDYEERDRVEQARIARAEKEQRIQEAMLSIKQRYGKNAVLKGMNLEEGGTTIERNKQVGGHKA